MKVIVETYPFPEPDGTQPSPTFTTLDLANGDTFTLTIPCHFVGPGVDSTTFAVVKVHGEELGTPTAKLRLARRRKKAEL